MAAPTEKTRYPGIYKRGSRYVVRYRVNGVRKSESCRTLDDARKLKRSRESARDRGDLDRLTESQVRFSEYAAEWIDRYGGNGRRGFEDSTRDEYRRDLERAISRLGDLKLSSIRHRDVADFVAWLCDEKAQGRSLSDGTVRRILAPVRSCLATALREGLIGNNPASGVPLPVRSEPDTEEKAKAMTRAELAAFLACTPPRWSLFFRTLAATGMRWGEITALQWGDLDLDGLKPCLHVRRARARGKEPKSLYKAPKTKYGKRTLPLDPALARDLRARRASVDTGEGSALVFPSRTGTPLDPTNTIRRVLQPIAGEAGVPWVGFHTFRHTAASLLIDSGRSIVQVQRFLGHHSPAFTLARYAHIMDEGVGPGIDLASLGGSKVGPPPPELSGTEQNTENVLSALEAEFTDSAVLAGTAETRS